MNRFFKKSLLQKISCRTQSENNNKKKTRSFNFIHIFFFFKEKKGTSLAYRATGSGGEMFFPHLQRVPGWSRAVCPVLPLLCCGTDCASRPKANRSATATEHIYIDWEQWPQALQ